MRLMIWKKVQRMLYKEEQSEEVRPLGFLLN